MTDRTQYLRNEVQAEVNNYTAQTGNKSIDGETILELMCDMYEDPKDQEILAYLCEGMLYAKPTAIN